MRKGFFGDPVIAARDGREPHTLRYVVDQFVIAGGRHTGELKGRRATGKAVGAAVMDCFGIGDGRSVEHCALRNNQSLVTQMGAGAARNGAGANKSERRLAQYSLLSPQLWGRSWLPAVRACAPADRAEHSMRRYFFNVSDGVTLPDKEGTELPDRVVARGHAIQFAGELMRDGARLLAFGEDWRMEVIDEGAS